MEKVTLLKLLDIIPLDIVMWGVFGVTLVVFGIYSAILLWHWKLYSTGKFTTVSNMIMYLGVSSVFLTIMIFSIISYTFAS